MQNNKYTIKKSQVKHPKFIMQSVTIATTHKTRTIYTRHRGSTVLGLSIRWDSIVELSYPAHHSSTCCVLFCPLVRGVELYLWRCTIIIRPLSCVTMWAVWQWGRWSQKCDGGGAAKSQDCSFTSSSSTSSLSQNLSPHIVYERAPGWARYDLNGSWNVLSIHIVDGAHGTVLQARKLWHGWCKLRKTDT